MPSFGLSLRQGAVSLDRLGELGRTLRRLDEHQRRDLVRDEARLLAVAAACSAAEFGCTLRREEQRLGRRAGLSGLEQQQQRSVRLRARADRESGMRAYSLWLDPLSAVGGRVGRPEIVVVVDTSGPESEPEIDWGLPVEIPVQVHHVQWWRHGGQTDVPNLLPLCHRHHQNVHVDGWVVQLGATRELTVRSPDGRTRSTGPPGRRAA